MAGKFLAFWLAIGGENVTLTVVANCRLSFQIEEGIMKLAQCLSALILTGIVSVGAPARATFKRLFLAVFYRAQRISLPVRQRRVRPLSRRLLAAPRQVGQKAR